VTAAVGDIIRITAVAQWAAQDFFTNTFYVKLTKQDRASDSLVMDGIADHLDEAYLLINPDISSSMNYDHIEGQNITQDVLMPDKSWVTLTVGGDAGTALPTQCAACVFYPTLRPRTHAAQFLWPYTQASLQTGGVVLAAAVTLIQSFGDFWVSGIQEVTLEADFGAYNNLLARFTPVIWELAWSSWISMIRMVLYGRARRSANVAGIHRG